MNILEKELMVSFPEYKDEIRINLSINRSFSDAAKDYIFCRNELSRLQLSKDINLYNQYNATLKDLEEEILVYLEDVRKITKSNK